MNQTDKTLLNLNLCFSAPSDLGTVDAEAVLGGDGGPRDHPFPLLDLLPCLRAQCHPTARAQTAKVRKEYWALLEEDWASKYLHCLQKSNIMESGNDCDPSVIVIMMERTQSDTQSKVSCCVATPAGLTLITIDGDYLEPFFPFYSI